MVPEAVLTVRMQYIGKINPTEVNMMVVILKIIKATRWSKKMTGTMRNIYHTQLLQKRTWSHGRHLFPRQPWVWSWLLGIIAGIDSEDNAGCLCSRSSRISKSIFEKALYWYQPQKLLFQFFWDKLVRICNWRFLFHSIEWDLHGQLLNFSLTYPSKLKKQNLRENYWFCGLARKASASV